MNAPAKFGAAIGFLLLLTGNAQEVGSKANIPAAALADVEGQAELTGPMRMIEQPAFPTDARGHVFGLMSDLERRPSPPPRAIKLREVPIPKDGKPPRQER
jgi:hypothetical protein